MSASTAVSPPQKKQSRLDERRCEEAGAIKPKKNLFLVLLFKGQREALLLLRKRTREGSRLSRALAKLDSHSEALRVSEAL